MLLYHDSWFYIYMSSFVFDIAVIVSVLSGLAGGAILVNVKIAQAKAAAANAAGMPRK